MNNNPPHDLLRSYVRGYCNSLVIAAAVKLSLPDLLAKGPISTEHIAQTLNLNPYFLERILKLLEVLHIVEFCPERNWHLNNVGYHLRKDISDSFAWEILFLTHPEILSAWGGLDLALKSNTSAYKALNNFDIFEYLEHAPLDVETFHKGWNRQTERLIPDILNVLNLSTVNHITEIAGGLGSLLRAILAIYPHLKSSFCEKSHMKKHVMPIFKSNNMMENVNFFFSDILEARLPRTDIIISKNFIHLFDDKEASLCLTHLRQFLNKKGRIVFIERLLEPHRNLQDVLYIDIMMLAVTGGKERTIDQFRKLLDKNDFKLEIVQPLKEGFFLIEGVIK